MKRFAEFNPVRLGVVGVCVVVAALFVVFNITLLPGVGGDSYRAVFAEVGALRVDDDVRIAGKDVGTVTGIELEGDRVVVSFRIDDQRSLGDETTARIKTATVLGVKYIELRPRGRGELKPGAAIPLARTTPPYRLNETLGQLTKTVERIDVRKVSQALETFSRTFEGTAPEVGDALRGVRRIAETVNKRDRLLQKLLQNAEGVTDVLAARSDSLNRIVLSGNALLAELQSRSRALEDLMHSIQQAAVQVNGLVQDNREQLGPALDHLNWVLEVVNANADDVAKALELVGPFATALGGAVASGPYFQATVGNLSAPSNLVPLSAAGIGFAKTGKGPSGSAGSDVGVLLDALEGMQGGGR